MSVEAMAWAYKMRLIKQPCAKAVLVALANRADEHGQCFPGLGDLEARTEWNRRTIQRALRLLEERQLLIVSPRCDPKTGKQSSNLYQLNMRLMGDTATPLGAAQRRREDDVATPRGAAQRQGEGGTATPESSSEYSIEQSLNLCAQVVAPPKSGPVWDAYSGEYQRRYGIEPVRNKKTNALLCQLVDRLGAEDAPRVAAFYVRHPKPVYVSNRHPATLLLRDAEGLRTECFTGRISGTVLKTFADSL